MSAEVSGQPWTRVAENATDGESSVWEWNGTEQIGVQLGDETAVYTLNADKTLTPDKQLYWKSTAQATVTAWYPSTDGTISLADQSEALAYVLAGSGTGDYQNKVNLTFTHKLAKVRVLLDGTQLDNVAEVEVFGSTSCTNNKGEVAGSNEEDWIKMKHTTYADGTECWEANVVPGDINKASFIRLNGYAVVPNLDGIPDKLSPGEMYTIDLTVGNAITDITADNCQDIKGDGYFRVSGQFGNTITITEGTPTIYLERANITAADAPAINITGGNPTILVVGDNNTITSSTSAGIYVASNSTVTITSEDEDEDKLTVNGNKGGSGIGSYVTNDSQGQFASCGSITISKVTLYAYCKSASDAGNLSPGIGGSDCVTINISRATIHAFGIATDNGSTPGIGGNYSYTGNIGSNIPTVKITDSEIMCIEEIIENLRLITSAELETPPLPNPTG